MRKCPRLTPKQKGALQTIISRSQSSGKEVRRAQAISLLDAATDLKVISALTKYSRRQIFDLRKNYLKTGISAIQDKQKGKPKELLTKKEREELIETVKTQTPRKHDYDSGYWTTSILGDFIQKQYKVSYKSKTSYYLIFRQAKFSYHKPSRLYERRNEEEVQEWRRQAKERVEEVWKDQDTVVLTEDEMSLSSQTTVQKIWLPQGEYPKIEVAKKRESRSLYGFLSIKTGQEHAFKTSWQNMYITAKILKKIRKIYPRQKILLIWDKAPSHQGSEAQEYIKKDKNIKTIYFPTAAPEQNPQEHVWREGRNQVTHNKFIKNIDKATDEFVDYLNNTRFHYSFLGHSAGS
jgi:transposase